jgi:glyoxylate reductase
MNILVTRAIPGTGLTLLKKAGHKITIGFKKIPTEAQLISAVKGKKYDALLTLLTDPITARVMDAAGPQLKVVSNYAVGFNNIDIDAASARNIIIANTAGTSGECVAEHSLALIFALSTRLVEADTFVRSGKYKGWDPMLFIGTDLCGKTLGIVGTGNIGEMLAQKAQAGFGMKVKYYDVVSWKK